MKKIVIFAVVSVLMFVAGCTSLISPDSWDLQSKNVIPLNYGNEYVEKSQIITSVLHIDSEYFIVYSIPLSENKLMIDTGFFKNQYADTGYEQITRLEVLHAESSYKYFGAGACVPSIEILFIEETGVFQGERRYLKYAAGYFSGGKFNIFQDTTILTAVMFGTRPYGPYGKSFGEFRSIILQEGEKNKTKINGSMVFPKKITILEEAASGNFWNDNIGSMQDCPVVFHHFFRLTVCSLESPPNSWYDKRPCFINLRDIDFGLDSFLNCESSVKKIDYAYAELRNDGQEAYLFAQEDSKLWERTYPIPFDKE